MSKASNRPLSRICVLVSGCLPPPIGGMATFYESLLDSSLPSCIDLNFVQTSSQKRVFENSGQISFVNLVSSFADCWRFARAIIVCRPQIAHIGTAFGLSFLKHSVCVMIARLCRVKILLHPHCSLSVLYAERPGWWKWYFRQIIALTNGIVVLSQEWLELEEIVSGCKVYALPNAINLKEYLKTAREHLNSSDPSGLLHVLYLGYIGKAKGSFDIIETAQIAIQRGYDWQFKLVGGELSPGENEMLHEKIRTESLKDYVIIHKPVFGPDKRGFFRWADIFVYPSYSEGMPMAVIEAMACGLPVVASKVGGLPDLITDGVNGLLVDPGCPDQIVDAIQKLAEDPMLRQSMGRQGYERTVNEYDIENRVLQLIDIYSSVLAKD